MACWREAEAEIAGVATKVPVASPHVANHEEDHDDGGDASPAGVDEDAYSCGQVEEGEATMDVDEAANAVKTAEAQKLRQAQHEQQEELSINCWLSEHQNAVYEKDAQGHKAGWVTHLHTSKPLAGIQAIALARSKQELIDAQFILAESQEEVLQAGGIEMCGSFIFIRQDGSIRAAAAAVSAADTASLSPLLTPSQPGTPA